MKKTLYQIFRYLPIILLVAFVFLPTDAQAQFGFVKTILGIDTEDNCVPPMTESKNVCYFCGMLEIIFNSAAKVASLAYQAFHTDLGQLIIIFLAVSLALITLRNIAAMGAQDPGALMNMLASRIFVCAAIYYIITRDYYNIFNLTITPILTDGMFQIGGIGGVSDFGNVGGFGHTDNLKNFGRTAGALDGDVMPRAVGTAIVSSVRYIEGQIQNLFEYGRWAMCRGNGPDKLFHILPNPFPIIDGVMLYIGGILFLIGYPWIMADAVIQLGISLALLPFALAGYAFGGTRQYLSKLFGWILNSLFVFIFMGIFIGCIIGYINGVILQAIRVHSDPVALFLNPITGLAFFGINMVKIIFALAIGWMYMPEIRDLAENFSNGAGLSAATNVGKSVTEPINKAAEKVADHAAQATAHVATATVHVAERKVRATTRQGMKAAVNVFGTPVGANKTFKIPGGRFTGNMEFTTVKNPDGTTYLKREFTSVTGRRHVMVSDKYSTTKLEYDRSGNLIKKETKFKHNFIKKHLVDKDGKINVGAVQTLLNSNLAQDPAFKQAIVEQFAIEVAKLQGKHVSTYFKSRNVVFNPNDPSKIYFEQIDHNGKRTLIDLQINMATGQYRAGYDQDLKRTHPLHEWERGMRIGAHNLALGGGRKKTWLGEYEMKVDGGTGELYYTRTRKKWLFFGPKIEKDFYKGKTVKHKTSTAKAVTKRRNNAAKIARKLRHAIPNGGKRTRKTLFHTYESYIDGHGQMVYTKKLRKGWNIKNYYRGARLATALTLRAPLALALPVVNLPLTLAHQIFRPKESAKALRYFGSAGRGLFRKATWTTKVGAKNEFMDIGQGLAHTIIGRTLTETAKDIWYGGNFSKTVRNSAPMQTGDVHEYTASGYTKKDSNTGATVTTQLNDETTEKTLDGTKNTKNNVTGDTSSDAQIVGERDLKIFGTFGSIEIHGKLDANGQVVDEITKYHYSDLIQEGHDHFTYKHGGNQVVEDNGNLAPDLELIYNGAPNPKALLWGFDEIFGKTAVGGSVMSDFMKQNIFQAGRRVNSNKIRTRISSVLV